MKVTLAFFLFSLLLQTSLQQFFRIPGKATRVKPSEQSLDAYSSNKIDDTIEDEENWEGVHLTDEKLEGEERLESFLEEVYTLTDEKPTYHKIPNVKPRLFGRISKPDPALSSSTQGSSRFQKHRIPKKSTGRSSVFQLPQPIAKKPQPPNVPDLAPSDPELSVLFLKIAKPVVAENESPIHKPVNRHSKPSGRSNLFKKLPKPITKVDAPVAQPLQNNDSELNDIFIKIAKPVIAENESPLQKFDKLPKPSGSSSSKYRRLPKPIRRKAHTPVAEPLQNNDPELNDIFMKVAKPVIAEVTSPRVDQSSKIFRKSPAFPSATKPLSSFGRISKPSSSRMVSSRIHAKKALAPSSSFGRISKPSSSIIASSDIHDSKAIVSSSSTLPIEVSVKKQRGNKPRVANFQLFQSANKPSLVIQEKPFSSEEDDSSTNHPTCPDNKYTYIIPNAEQCDAYYTCEAGEIRSELCPDGLVLGLEAVKCVEPQYEKCEGRPGLQPSQGTGPCVRKNGVFNPSDSCDKFVTCQDDAPIHGQCAEGLVFNPEEKVCAWADEVLRADCMPSDVLGFICPNPVLPLEVARKEHIQLRFGDHDRHADVSDCRYFFMCLISGHPRKAGCGGGKVFDSVTGACSPPEGVDGCENYYKLSSSKEYTYKGLLSQVNRG